MMGGRKKVLSRLTRRKLVHRIRFVSLVSAGLAMLVAPALQAGPSQSAEGKVRLELRGKDLGYGHYGGRFVLSGALSDRGRWVQKPGRPAIFVSLRTLYGAKGTIRMRSLSSQGTNRPYDRWVIVAGTRAYAGLRGRGRETGLYANRVRVNGTGTVWQSNR
jgi:hypothetical protein